MDFETFKKAVDSLKGYDGMVGIMGGEPTLHPEFPKFVDYYASQIQSNRPPEGKPALAPIKDFAQFRQNHLSNLAGKRGLWSCLGRRYYENFEKIQDVFDYQCINDHTNPGIHQGLLITRKELGIADEEWIELRDNCWIQRLWSSSITPKGAFFCEVAAALDMLFDGPGGWPIEPGWWKRTPDQFVEQLKWCEMCSAALPVPGHPGNEEIDDVSPVMYEKLLSANSPKAQQGMIQLFSPDQRSDIFQNTGLPEPYISNTGNLNRIAATNTSIRPQNIALITISPLASQNISESLREQLKSKQVNDWILIVDEQLSLPTSLLESLSEWVLNPGCLYFAFPNQHLLKKSVVNDQSPINQIGLSFPSSQLPAGLILFNRRASALNNLQTDTLLSELADAKNDWNRFLEHWSNEKRQYLNLSDDNENLRKTIHQISSTKTNMLRSHVLSLWLTVRNLPGTAALFGNGAHTSWLLTVLEAENLPMPDFIIDDSPKQSIHHGVPVLSSLKALPEINRIMISSDTIHEKLTQKAKALFPDTVQIINPYLFFSSPTFNK